MPSPPRPLSPVTWFRQHAERTPLRLLLLTLVVLLPCVLYAADKYADMWAVRALDETVAEARARLALRQRTMNDEFELAFAGLRRLPDLLALDDRVRDEVAPRPEAAPHKPPQASVGRRAPLNAFLKTFAETMDLHIAWLIDHTGLTIATSNYDSADSLLGTNYADRAYFIAAMSGERGRQFAVGRVSSVPGFFFASPVRQCGTVLGVVAVKTDLPTLSRRLRLDAAFVTDEQGVVVLANDKAHIFHALPDAPVRDMPVSARLLRYKREAFPELSLRPFVVRGISETHGLTLIGEATRPALLGVIHRPQDGLSLHVAEDVGEALTLEDRRQVRFHLAVLSGLAVLGTLLSAIIYTLRNRAQLHIIEANNQALTRLNGELRCMAERDHLTGCFNRRRLDEAMNAELARSARSGHPLALAMLDLDHFKTVNDRHGHGVGDAMLAHVTEIIRNQLREPDLLARVGGEEFALLLPDTGEREAVALLERVRRKVEENPLPHADAPIPMTVSAGVAEARPDIEPGRWMHEADAALYMAKRCGRNRTVRATQVPDDSLEGGDAPPQCAILGEAGNEDGSPGAG
ncbi:diguanylate cyclase [Desulfovibrio oxamicus]|uniref:diguanylate cyclase n=1 Tax=Nitratidesulfovibrio oxamicus TaxID=32016 RepID=A0ABS0J275_9BACT|nr:sensor domain-containing diguanylate cyclase [Nitratidesulfovibrio oxamicus]MBG3876305.1 diguanylate cyclase [Nitratidesulfovibrio oxamicus]